MRRYDSYKDSGVEWIGEIPNNWGVTKMKYVGDYLNGYPFKPTDWGDEGRLIIRIQNLTEGRGSENFYSGEIDPKYIVRTGDYLFSWSTTLGLYEWKRDEGLLNQHIFKVELNNILFKKYYFWVIQGVIKELSNESHGSTMTHLTKDVFGNIRLPLPPLSEQQQIVSYLDTKTSLIDTLIENTQKKIELLKEKRTSLISEVVTKGLNPNVEMKDSGVEWIGEIPRGWITSKLGFYATKIGSGSTPRGGSEVYVDSGVPFIRSQNVHFEGLRLDDISFIDYYVHKSMKGSTVLKNNVLLNITGGSIGRCCVVDIDIEMNVNQHVSIIRTTPQLINYFLNYILSCDLGQSQVRYNLTGGNREGLTIEGIRDIQITIPPLYEQEEIVSYLDEQTQLIDKTISVEERRIDTLKEYRQSLISEVVTGKRKVTNDE
jgi:type I restriction enzyme S subunit